MRQKSPARFSITNLGLHLCCAYTYRKAIKVFIPAIFQLNPTGFHLLDYHTARSYSASKLGCTRHNTRKSGLWVCGHAQLLHSAAWCATSEPSVYSLPYSALVCLKEKKFERSSGLITPASAEEAEHYTSNTLTIVVKDVKIYTTNG